jgi:hypothetical protein
MKLVSNGIKINARLEMDVTSILVIIFASQEMFAKNNQSQEKTVVQHISQRDILKL